MQQAVKKARTIVATRREVRYVISGAASAGIEFLSFIVLFAVTDWLYFSNSLSFALGVISGFIFHTTWSFPGEKRFKTHQQFVGYVSLAGFNFIAINVLVGFFVNGLGIWPFAAKFLAICITVVWTYVLSTALIFRAHPAPKDRTAAEHK